MNQTELKTQLTELFSKARYKSFTIWQVITAIQICVIFSLIGTITYKAYVNRKTNKETEAQVAGIATAQYSIPNEISITIEDVTKSFDPIDFGFEYKDVTDGKNQNKIVKAVRSLIKKDETDTTVYDKYLDFDQTKFNYWLKANFGILEKEIPQKPQIKLFENSTQISECILGYSTKKIPVATILEDLKKYKQIPEDLYFVVDVGQLAEDEQKINDICNKINLFERNLRKVKIKNDGKVAQEGLKPEATPTSADTKQVPQPELKPQEAFKSYDFLEESDVNKIFSFNIIKDELVIKITKKDELRKAIERVKRIFDEKPDTKQVRIGDKLMIVGEEKEIILINTEESIRVAENLLIRGNEIENFPIIVEKNDGIYDSNQVLKFPKKIASGEVKIPTNNQNDAIRMTQLIDLYDNLVFEPNETFSFKNKVTDSKLASFLETETPIVFNTTEEKVEYYKSLEPVSTLFFRLALDSGLPFVERYQNVLNKNIGHFGYPVSEMPLVNITGKGTKNNGDGTTKERIIDLRFVNPSDQQIIILTDYEFRDNNELILKAEMYTTQQFNSTNAQIKNFQKESFDMNGRKGYFIVFNRIVNETDETYSIYYYDDQNTPQPTPTPAN